MDIGKANKKNMIPKTNIIITIIYRLLTFNVLFSWYIESGLVDF